VPAASDACSADGGVVPFSAERCASATSAPALAAAAVVAVPHGTTLQWLMESCVGIGTVKMGVPGLAAQVFFFSPVTSIMNIVSEKSTGKMPLLPFSAMCANGAMWITYGVLLDNPAIWAPNLPALAMGGLYTAVFLRYCPADANWLPLTRSWHLAGIAAAVGLSVGLAAVLPSDQAANIIGTVAVGVCIVMFTGPLAAMKTVLQDRSTKTLSLPMTIATVVNCSLWTYYGAAMINDSFIWFPNALGLASGLAQVALFARFGIR